MRWFLSTSRCIPMSESANIIVSSAVWHLHSITTLGFFRSWLFVHLVETFLGNRSSGIQLWKCEALFEFPWQTPIVVENFKRGNEYNLHCFLQIKEAYINVFSLVVTFLEQRLQCKVRFSKTQAIANTELMNTHALYIFS